MIADQLANWKTYKGLGSRFETAFTYLEKTDLSSLTPDKYMLDGDNVYVMIQEYDTKEFEKGRYEAHEKYIDIQYIISGSEKMGYAPLEQLTLTEDARPAKDMLYYQDSQNQGSLIKIESGMFAVFFPQDGHMPNISPADGQVSKNKKAVVKILVD